MSNNLTIRPWNIGINRMKIISFPVLYNSHFVLPAGSASLDDAIVTRCSAYYSKCFGCSSHMYQRWFVKVVDLDTRLISTIDIDRKLFVLIQKINRAGLDPRLCEFDIFVDDNFIHEEKYLNAKILQYKEVDVMEGCDNDLLSELNQACAPPSYEESRLEYENALKGVGRKWFYLNEDC